MTKRSSAWIVGIFSFAVPAIAVAHVTVASGPGFANATQEITFGVGHGCAGADTYSVRVDIPPGVTSVRPESSDFGKATVTKDAAGVITAVTWQKDDKDALDSDTNYYKLTVRVKVPDEPFTTLLFPAHQTCRAANGTLTVVDWVGASEPLPDAGGPEPAPALVIMPARTSGWNKVKVPVALADLTSFFGDAIIVWKGNAAFSTNPNTTDMIKSTADVTALTTLQANDEVWVKY